MAFQPEDIGASDIESILVGGINEADNVGTEIGQWDIISQISATVTRLSETKKAVGQTQKRKTRRTKHQQARQAADMQKALVRRYLLDAEQLRQQLELPAKGEREAALADFSAEAVRYDRQGKRFLELASEYGAIRAKNRVRDETKSYFYARKMGRKECVWDSGFGDVLAAYQSKIRKTNGSYYRSG